ncbi:MAG: 1-deoxy-D-xylulose-5-phosphate reductoisomerase [Candidatus Omnitrophica bacterium]|nr:1-deoxy-D-xylulose-5-phosphate reductoisomerase [Candidatus Omnitrophota bacterium]
MQRIAVLGSTGSVGRNTLEVIKAFPHKFCVVGLTTNSRIDILYQQIRDFQPALIAVKDEVAARRLEQRLNLKKYKYKLFVGKEGLKEIVKDKRIDKILLAISGADALLPLLSAIENKKDIALANKEALVMAGRIIIEKAKRNKVKILPVDSEASAIWQCLEGQDKKKLKNIYLTASGGPFRRMQRSQLKDISINRVLKHPRWKMGKKISVDSATLMNKGFEVLEIMSLFNVSLDKIKVVIHPEAIIHSMVEFIDGSILAQLSVTDMRLPIQYALSYPRRLPSKLPAIDFFRLKALHFEKPNLKHFPCLELAYQAGLKMGTMPAVLNAANDISVNAFLEKKLDFVSIPVVIEKVLSRHKNITNPDLENILSADSWARDEAKELIARLDSR